MKKIQEKHEKENNNVEIISYTIQDIYIYQLKEEQPNLYRIEQQVENKILNKKR